MTGETYRILDEPRPGPLSRAAMNPLIPFFAFLLLPIAGIGLFILNAFALNGPNRWTEAGLAAAAYPLRIAITLAIIEALKAGGWPQAWLPYLLVVPLAAYLWVGYKIYLMQAPAYELRQYFKETEGRL